MKLKPITIKTLCALSLSLAMPAAFAGNITDINVSSLPDNQKIIKIKFDKDVVSPSGFITTTPARIALDFPGTGIQLAQPVLEYADPLLGQITAAQNNDRARILLALSKAGQYNTQIKGNEVWVYVSEAAEQTQTIAAAESISSRTLGNEPVAPPAPRARAEQAVAGANIDFRRGNRNSGIIEFNAPAFTGEPDIKQQSDRLVITLKNYPLPAQAQRSAAWMCLISTPQCAMSPSSASATTPSSLSATKAAGMCAPNRATAATALKSAKRAIWNLAASARLPIKNLSAAAAFLWISKM